MFRRSGCRFADKNMRKTKESREHVPIPKERNMLYDKQDVERVR